MLRHEYSGPREIGTKQTQGALLVLIVKELESLRCEVVQDVWICAGCLSIAALQSMTLILLPIPGAQVDVFPLPRVNKTLSPERREITG